MKPEFLERIEIKKEPEDPTDKLKKEYKKKTPENPADKLEKTIYDDER